MFQLINQEVECKVNTTSAGLAAAEDWCLGAFGQGFGIRPYQKNSYYFDTKSRLLLKAGVSFRKKVGSFSYVLKVPSCKDKSAVARLEIFHKQKGRPLSLEDPFDRQFEILRRLLPILSSNNMASYKALAADFSPAVLLQVDRRYRRIANADGTGWLASIAFDKCAARLVGGTRQVEWHEIEVEAHNTVLGRRDLVEEIAGAICTHVNGTRSDVGKYEHAVTALETHFQ